MRPCATTFESELAPDELAALLDHLGSSSFRGPHLEIGTAVGGTLWRMVNRVRETRPGVKFVVLDPMRYFPEQFEKVRKNLRDNGIDPATIDFRICKSDEGYRKALAAGERFDFIFIDGNHKCRYVMEDLRWASMVNEGGTVVLHDYGPRHEGVVLAVDRFLGKNTHYRRVGLTTTLLVLQKVRASAEAEVSVADLVFARIATIAISLRSSFRKRMERLRIRTAVATGCLCLECVTAIVG